MHRGASFSGDEAGKLGHETPCRVMPPPGSGARGHTASSISDCKGWGSDAQVRSSGWRSSPLAQQQPGLDTPCMQSSHSQTLAKERAPTRNHDVSLLSHK